ncbi:hypothetical protein FN846DRAFT_180079 [Sphaerosporella brunnea]|uniref:Uncharacterized protein n=1 Tax=Sphaerosporella brunnea TaxID=1250544 RepID=A0A5J5F8R1_9PEZI|nr:hypothetical protein FN846DRAFT_180079 [Sphaerosporella brunnea]
MSRPKARSQEPEVAQEMTIRAGRPATSNLTNTSTVIGKPRVRKPRAAAAGAAAAAPLTPPTTPTSNNNLMAAPPTSLDPTSSTPPPYSSAPASAFSPPPAAGRCPNCFSALPQPSSSTSQGAQLSSAILRAGQEALAAWMELRDQGVAAILSDAQEAVENLVRLRKRPAVIMCYKADIKRVVAESIADGDRQHLAWAAKSQQLAAAAYINAMAQEESSGEPEQRYHQHEQRQPQSWLETVLLRD